MPNVSVSEIRCWTSKCLKNMLNCWLVCCVQQTLFYVIMLQLG